MALFKSREAKRIERDIQIRKGMNLIKRQIKELAKNEKDYLEKAKRAKKLGSRDQFEFLKKALRRSASQRVMMERQLLNIETAAQVKNQAEAHAEFAKAMNAISKSIGEMFGSTDMARTQREFERAMAKAESMEQRMEIFLDMSSHSMFGYEGDSSEELVTEDEIDRMIEEEAAHEEGDVLQDEISKGLNEIQRELGKES